MMFDNFFKGKKVFITGHTGFKGSWLAVWLMHMGAHVTGFALPPKTSRDHFTVLGLAKRMRHNEGDIRDFKQIQRAIAKARPEIIFHLAAQPLVRLSYAEPKLTFDTNVGGAVNLLDSIRSCPSVRTLVFITSDKCYRNKEWAWGYRENDELGGPDSYSASKACAELVFTSYQESYFHQRPNFAAATARAGNVIGGGDWSQDRIVPDCIRALEKGEPITVRNPIATRPWQHVLEPLSGYLLLAQKLASKNGEHFRGAWNFGPTKESNRTVRELVEKTLKVWGHGKATMAKKKPGALHEARFLHLNCDKAHQELNWSPTWHFDDGVEQTILWYREILKQADAWSLTTSQIEAYELAAKKLQS
ncbi:MAG TPA: CDP-glucose 4,6-dehydratase [Verrucomicrobiae bacterium]|nr:CDP-glucose 4,6-dehydratase [Verrucomicrobiae bacterium]